MLKLRREAVFENISAYNKFGAVCVLLKMKGTS